MYSVRWPWASRSISNTRWPCSASAAPRLTAVVVFPTPPFCIATAIVRAKSAPSLTEYGDLDPAGLARGSSRARHLEWRPTCDHRHPRRPGAGDRAHHRIPARRYPAADGRDLFLRHSARSLSLPRAVHERDAEAAAADLHRLPAAPAAWLQDRAVHPEHRPAHSGHRACRAKGSEACSDHDSRDVPIAHPEAHAQPFAKDQPYARRVPDSYANEVS